MESPACSKEQPALNSLRWIHYMGVISKRTQWFPEPSYCCSLQKSCWKPSQEAKLFLRGGNPLFRLSTVITLFKVFQSHTTIFELTIAVVFKFITKSPPNVDFASGLWSCYSEPHGIISFHTVICVPTFLYNDFFSLSINPNHSKSQQKKDSEHHSAIHSLFSTGLLE